MLREYHGLAQDARSEMIAGARPRFLVFVSGITAEQRGRIDRAIIALRRSSCKDDIKQQTA